MTDADRIDAPTTAEAEQRFRSVAVRAARPVVVGTIGALGVVRGFRWAAEGVDRVAACTEPVIFAANHVSHADTAAILGTLPKHFRRRTCVAAALDVFGPTSNEQKGTMKSFKRECLQIIVAAGFHAFAFDRYGPPLRSLRTALGLSRNGWNLLLYPEGTRSRDGEMGPFKAGVGVLAKSTGRPVIPIYVTGGNTVLPCGGFMPGRGQVMVRYGEALRFQAGESAAEFTQRLHQQIRAMQRTAAATAPGSDVGRDATLAAVSQGDVSE